MASVKRLAIRIEGTVQGVGFRPFVYGLASRFHLGGFVRNDGGSVTVEVEGENNRLSSFLRGLVHDTPPLAHVDRLSCTPRGLAGDSLFRIEHSSPRAGDAIQISPDIATCHDCLTELFDSRDRRFRYPFLNCTNCGPRLTIIRGAPYDRDRTTMVGFALCPACRAEYEDPGNRRFHAQPTACAVCGPRLTLWQRDGTPVASADPIKDLCAALLAGQIAAVKGLGGFHLVCDARNKSAVAELRHRKQREEKPFAVMVADLPAARELCEVATDEAVLLMSPARPIVLLNTRKDSVASGVAPGNPLLGVMLPYTPLHHLLLADMRGVPLVMTSGNRSDEPIVCDAGSAVERLGDIADLFLVHDRPIHVRCDDSVSRIVRGAELPMRRSRGYAPQPIALAVVCPEPILAVGGQLKSTFALGIGRRAILSQHMGDLDHADAIAAFERDIPLLEKLFEVSPQCIAHDLHPDYASTRYARRLAEQGMRCIPVQHHHAHMASCMAEHGLDEPVIGISFDGTGFGLDGAVWGGEFLIGDYCTFRRAAHLRYVPMPGGDMAIRQPWRMALAYLEDAGTTCGALEARIDRTAARAIRQMIERKFNSPRTSSVGRLFDAVASLVGVRDQVSYEGQAAIELEWLASTVTEECGSYSFDLAEDGEIDARPMIREIARDASSAAVIAHRFHQMLVEVIDHACTRIRKQTGLKTVVLSGGVFCNAWLATHASERLERNGFVVYRHQKVPCNDGGLSLGQLAIAARRVNER